MDSHNQYGVHTNSGINAQSASRVYINPNFQRNNRVLSQNASVSLKSQIHQNTDFPTQSLSRPKIYVNPNFVKTSSPIPLPSVNENYLTLGAGDVRTNAGVNSYYGIPNVSVCNARTNIAVLNSCYSSTTSAANIFSVNNSHSTMTAVTSATSLPNITTNILPQWRKQHVVVGCAKSRYSLVRLNNDPIKITATPSNRTVTKMRISKYKTVSVDHAKNLQTERDKLRLVALPKIISQDVAEKAKRIRPQFIQSSFKLVKKNMGTTVTKVELKTPIKRKLIHNSAKVLLRSNNKLKTTIEISKFKKNNIPCPLYRKYGTCLRNSRGKCEFLHDRKHVSICRKFLKGICHDKTCILSHDVTAEKMPTCYFYLKGMCTKEDCPYLHIKLNEKANVCLEFLKGYCVKGDKCLNRHVNICPDQAMKGVCSRRTCPYPHRPKKNVAVSKIKTRVLNQNMKSKTNKSDKISEVGEKYLYQNSNIEGEKGQDRRYYKEVVEEVTSLEVIKPTRCKLGALPSFIQL